MGVGKLKHPVLSFIFSTSITTSHSGKEDRKENEKTKVDLYREMKTNEMQ